MQRRIRDILRKPLMNSYNKRLKNKKVTILSANCIGGTMYHDAMIKFLSPTINLTIPDFLRFVENLDYYLKSDLVYLNNDKTTRHFDCVLGNDLLIKFYHASSVDECLKKWKERSNRITNSIFLVATDEFIKTKQDKERFDKLPYPKVCFVSRPAQYSWECYLPEFRNFQFVGDSTKIKYYVKEFLKNISTTSIGSIVGFKMKMYTLITFLRKHFLVRLSFIHI